MAATVSSAEMRNQSISPEKNEFLDEKAQNTDWKIQGRLGGRIDLTSLSMAEWATFLSLSQSSSLDATYRRRRSR
jgi:hypothetical protein